MQDKNLTILNLASIIKRIMTLEGYKNQEEVAMLLGFSPSTFTQRKKANSIPFKELWNYCCGKSQSFTYILTGNKTSQEEDVLGNEDQKNILEQRIELLKDQNQFLNAKILELEKGDLKSDEYQRKKAGESYPDQSWKKEEGLLVINS